MEKYWFTNQIKFWFHTRAYEISPSVVLLIDSKGMYSQVSISITIQALAYCCILSWVFTTLYALNAHQGKQFTLEKIASECDIVFELYCTYM